MEGVKLFRQALASAFSSGNGAFWVDMGEIGV